MTVGPDRRRQALQAITVSRSAVRV